VGRLAPSTKVLGASRKRVLKAVGRDLLPHQLLHRGKRGFGVPLDRWFRTDLEGYARSLLCSDRARLAQHLHGPAVRQLMDEHRAGAADHGHSIWTLLTLEVFLRQVGW
jgi:asparagine synthase (glutamine-hydrolysing)